jgi:hypothetical protein
MNLLRLFRNSHLSNLEVLRGLKRSGDATSTRTGIATTESDGIVLRGIVTSTTQSDGASLIGVRMMSGGGQEAPDTSLSGTWRRDLAATTTSSRPTFSFLTRRETR